MKKTEAISILATSVRPREAKDRARYDEAVKMAIEALRCSEIPNSSDSISRQAAIDALDCINGVEEVLRSLPSAQPDNQINLCDSCDYSYPECPAKYDDVIFGNGIGNDNICACNKYKPSAQPETAKRIVGKSRDGMTLWYQCDMCNEPVNLEDSFCSGCGRRLTDG